MPQRGPDAIQRKSLAIFIRLTATVFKAPLISTKASCAPLRLEMVFGLAELKAGQFAEASMTRLANSGWALRPVPDRRPSQGQLSQ